MPAVRRAALGIAPGGAVDDVLRAGHKGQQHPAGPSGQRTAHRRERGLPAIDRAAVAGEHCGAASEIASIASEAGEIQLVKDHRVMRDQLLAFQSGEHEAGHRGEIGALEFRRDGFNT